ncbi:MAG: phosphatase PAP2 family protein [Chloroflexi bacterium]|nr:phosphatase PAP2 family protein [Chloroflexota bacterium]
MRTSPGRLVCKSRFLPAVAMLSLFGFVAILFWVRVIKPIGIDRSTTLVFQRVSNQGFYRSMSLASSLGYPPTIQLLWLAATAVMALRRRWLEAIFTLASAGAAASVILIKALVGRPRPAGERIRVATVLPDFGFPSSHTAHYVSFYGFLAYLGATQLRPGLRRRLSVALPLFLVALVGPSRVYLGQHWLSDVIAAYLFGLAYLIGLTRAYRRLKAMKLDDSSPRLPLEKRI